MFGYVKPEVPELKVAEYELYNAVYCGLCREMGRATGQLSRFTLSYDFTWLACVRMIAEGIVPEVRQIHCPAHPTKRRSAVLPNAALETAAALSAVLAYLKNRDDLCDERGFRHFRAAAADLPVKMMCRRGEGLLPEGSFAALDDKMTAFSMLEDIRCDSLDRTAGAFGDVLSYVFRAGLPENTPSCDICGEIGFHVGKFVYVCDAVDDLTGDIAAGRYNPIAAGFGELALSPDGTISSLAASSVEISLPLELDALGKAVERLANEFPPHPLTGIIKNTVYLGMPSVMKKLLSRETVKSKKQNHKSERQL